MSSFMYAPRTDAERDARDHLMRAYLNTGCTEDEALADANRVFSERGSQACYLEAARYLDM